MDAVTKVKYNWYFVAQHWFSINCMDGGILKATENKMEDDKNVVCLRKS